jgi:hypothetical protein
MATDTPQPTPLAPLGHWFGLRPPETAVVAWGARAIGTHGDLDLVWNRLQCDPTCRPAGQAEPSLLHQELHHELDSYFLPLVRQRLKDGDPALRGNSDELTEVRSGRVTFRMSPNASGGYIYLCGFIDQADLIRPGAVGHAVEAAPPTVPTEADHA